MIRVVLFLALAGLGLDHAHTRQQLDALAPPRIANAWHELLHPPGPPPPPPLPPAPAPLGEFP